MAPFRITKHAEVRIQQRGRRPKDIEFVLKHGSETSGGILLTRQDADAIEQEAKREIALARKLRNVFIACENGVVKTVFKASIAQQRRMC
jgi:Domain of unknown function (DUF4258)